MNAETQTPIAFVALNDVIQPDYRTVIVRRALNFRRQAAPATRQRFDVAVAKHVTVATLDEHIALSPATIATVTQVCQRDDRLMQAVLALWQQSQLPLARRMREFLQTKGLETCELEQLKESFVGARPQETMLALVEEFHGRNPSFNNYDIALMLCCVHGYLPGSTAAHASAIAGAPKEDLPDLLAQLDADEVMQTRWHKWLAEMRALPLESDEWDDITVKAFALAARRLGKQRQRERQERQERLVNALKLLREQATAELEYFGFDTNEWQATTVGLSEVMVLADAVTTFYTELMAHRAGLQQPPAETRAAQIARRHEIEGLEEQVIATFAQLDARFQAQPAAPREPAPAESAPPPSEATAPANTEATPEMAIAVGSAAPLFASHAETPAHANGTHSMRRGLFRRK